MALTNLLNPSTFSMSNVTESSGVYTFATGTTGMITQSLPTPTVGHLYYGRCQQLSASGFSCLDGRFEYFGGDGEGKNIVFTSAGSATTDGQWHSYSSIVSFPSISGSGWTLRSFTVNGTATFQRKEMLIIDLTESFGSGNEPSKAWCDACIPYFTGSYSDLNYTITHNGNTWSSSKSLGIIPLMNGTTYSSISSVGTRTLNCSGKICANNLVIGAKILNCAGKKMAGDVVITTESAIIPTAITLTTKYNALVFTVLNGSLYTDSSCSTLAQTNVKYTQSVFYYNSAGSVPTGSYISETSYTSSGKDYAIHATYIGRKTTVLPSDMLFRTSLQSLSANGYLQTLFGTGRVFIYFDADYKPDLGDYYYYWWDLVNNTWDSDYDSYSSIRRSSTNVSCTSSSF